MAAATARNATAFEKFWPQPGIALLVLLAGWLYYMGYITEADDLRTAYYGLAGVATLTLLLALRKTKVRREQRAAREKAEAEKKRRESSSVSLSGTAQESDEARERNPEGAIPRNARTRALQAAGVATGIGADGEAAAHFQQVTSAAADADKDGKEEPKAEAESPVALRAVESPPAAPAEPQDFDPKAALERLEALVNREKAERGAQLARLESAVSEKSAATIPANLEEQLKQFLTIQAFNNAMNQKVFPRIEQVLSDKLTQELDPEALRKKVGSVGEGQEAAPAVSQALAEIRQQLEATIEEAGKERENLREEVRAARRLAEKAVSDIADSAAVGGGGDTSGIADLREKVASLTSTLDAASLGGGDGADVAGPLRQDLETLKGELDQRASSVMAMIGEQQKSLQQLQSDLAGIRARQESLAAGLDADGSSEGGSTDTSATTVQSEVAALRDALTTIISQNQQIQEKQDLINARVGGQGEAPQGEGDKTG